MWKHAENSSDTRPAEIDETSSRAYVYVRKNIVFVQGSGEGEETIPDHYEWEEMKIPRQMWEVCRNVFDHSAALDDVYDALAELAEMIIGEE